MGFSECGWIWCDISECYELDFMEYSECKGVYSVFSEYSELNRPKHQTPILRGGLGMGWV